MVNPVCRMFVAVESVDMGSMPTEVEGRGGEGGRESGIHLHLHYTVVTKIGSLHTLTKMWYKDSLELIVATCRKNFR